MRRAVSLWLFGNEIIVFYHYLRGIKMAVFTHGNISIEIDEDGFIEDPSTWNEDVAKALATTEDVFELTPNHWKVIHYLRDYFAKYGIAPMIRQLCKETGFPLKEIYELFPSGPAKGACKVAGLAKPTGCV
ncbi:MAG: dsrC [Ignavibacteria bacterium]|nr:dsrC [Ignavibacteria bacterium]